MASWMRWPTQMGRITQRFGVNPNAYAKFGLPGHEGLDLAAGQGEAVYAVYDGLVSDVRLDNFSDPLVKPYGNQVRIQHANGYETVYAHLSRTAVVRGQVVKAKQLIGLAGSTGYTGEAHLHLGLKKRGATVNGETQYPYDLIDPEPYLVPFGSPDDAEVVLPEPSMGVEVVQTEAGPLTIYAVPYEAAEPIASVDAGEVLDALEDAEVVRAKIGKAGQWLWVRTRDGEVGWAAATSLEVPDSASVDASDPERVAFVVVDSAGDNLRLRFGPGIDFDEVTKVPDGTLLKALDDVSVVLARVGRPGEWLHVQAPEGQVGYCAAWFLTLEPFGDKPVIPQPPVGTPTAFVVVECPGAGLRLREGPGTSYARTWWMPHRTVLESLDDPVVTGQKVAQRDMWIRVRTPARYEGYAAAWYLRYPSQEDERPRVTKSGVRTGESPHIFGIHALAAADDQIIRDRMRGLYHESGKTGWVLFTEICGRHARSISLNGEIRRRLWNWADAGYGVIIRLNHGYEPGGTLPESRLYDDFAAAAARWVEVYLKDGNRPMSDYTWAIQIGNEQNNPREHPGGFENPVEHITAERYADAFNRTYARIKAVLPNAIVCPGGLDPFNYMPMARLGNARTRPLDYFTEMMANIDVLDGIVLHTYTHGPNPAYITHLKRFGDGSGPLGDHYYDFQSYRVFMERIPAKWRDLPVYITEMNHIHRPAGEYDQGWVNQNVGWVRAAYAEIDRWNQQPYAQQIRCALIYRWMGDAWSIENKPEILTEFKQALGSDFRWRAAPQREAFSFAASSLSADGAQPRELEERFLTSPDDMTRIGGVGARAAAALNAAGIYLFGQLARLTPEQLADIIGETGIRAQYLSTWPEQARLAAVGDWVALEEYREKLRES